VGLSGHDADPAAAGNVRVAGLGHWAEHRTGGDFDETEGLRQVAGKLTQDRVTWPHHGPPEDVR